MPSRFSRAGDSYRLHPPLTATYHWSETLLARPILFSSLGHPSQIRLKRLTRYFCSSLVMTFFLIVFSEPITFTLILYIVLAISIAFSALILASFSYNWRSSSLYTL